SRAIALPPAASIAATVSSNCDCVREVTHTAAPAAAKPLAISCPKPRPPPVTIATWPLKSSAMLPPAIKVLGHSASCQILRLDLLHRRLARNDGLIQRDEDGAPAPRMAGEERLRGLAGAHAGRAGRGAKGDRRRPRALRLRRIPGRRPAKPYFAATLKPVRMP